MSPEIDVPPGLTTNGLIARRYLARIVDSIVIFFAVGLSGSVFGALLPSMSKEAVTLVLSLLSGAVWFGYGALCESSRAQATLGKRIAGLRVYNALGGRSSFLQAAGRNVVKDAPSSSSASSPASNSSPSSGSPPNSGSCTAAPSTRPSTTAPPAPGSPPPNPPPNSASPDSLQWVFPRRVLPMMRDEVEWTV